jgi:zinc protease
MRLTAALALSLLAALPASGQRRAVAPPAPVQGATVEGITEYTLANGMRVLLFPDNSKPTVTVNITYLVGSRHEGYGETGMAHLLEHLLFKGTPRHRDIPKELSERGARPNGTTWYDRTNYFETVASTDENLEWALDLEADRMVNSFVARKDLESEMTVVRNEYESGENNPVRVLLERVGSTAFLWHNYGKSTIGARADIENVPIERLQAFYRKYYQPDNAVLAVAGKFDPAATLRLINRKFGTIPRPVRSLDRGNLLYPTYTRDPVQDGERTVTVRRTGDIQLVMAGYHTPALAHPDNAAVQVLSQVIAASPNGRLYKSLVDTKLAASVQTFTFDLREPSILYVWAQLTKDQSMATARAAMTATLDSLRTTEVDAAEVERARNELVKGIEQLLDNSEQVGTALSEFQASGDWRLLHLTRDRLKAVTAADVQRVARAYFKPDNRTLGLYVPTDAPDRAEIPEAPDVNTLVRDYKGTQRVAAGEAFDATPANIDRRTLSSTLPNGMRVTLLPKKSRGEVVQGQVILRFGTRDALMGRRLAGTLLGAMLDRGTAARSRQALKDTLDKMKASVSTGGTVRSASANFQVKRDALRPTLQLVAEMLKAPGLDSAEFEKLRTEGIAQAEAALKEPQAIVFTALNRVGAPTDPRDPLYVPTIAESLAELKAMSLADLRAFHRDFYGATNADIGLVGDFDADSVTIPEPYERTDSTLISVETPDKANAVFVAVQAVRLSDSHEQYPAMAVASEVLGGGFLKSRMADRIRQKEGVSYGVGTFMNVSPGDSAARLATYAIYAPQNLDRLQSAFREELDRFVKDGITQDELDQARTGWLRQRQQEYANDNELVGRLITNRRYSRTVVGYDAALEDRVKRLTVADVNAAIRANIDPKQTIVIRAGDFEGARRKAATPTP